MYTAKKGLVEKQNPSVKKNEQELWYSAFEASVVSINLYGFNRSYCGDLCKYCSTSYTFTLVIIVDVNTAFFKFSLEISR